MLARIQIWNPNDHVWKHLETKVAAAVAAAPKGRDFYYNASTNEMELVKNPSPHRPTLQAANKADPAAGAKYIDWWNRIETKNRT